MQWCFVFYKLNHVLKTACKMKLITYCRTDFPQLGFLLPVGMKLSSANIHCCRLFCLSHKLGHSEDRIQGIHKKLNHHFQHNTNCDCNIFGYRGHVNLCLDVQMKSFCIILFLYSNSG